MQAEDVQAVDGLAEDVSTGAAIRGKVLDGGLGWGWHRYRILTSSVAIVISLASGVVWGWLPAVIVTGLACLPIIDSILRRPHHRSVSLWSMVLDTTVIGIALVVVRVPVAAVAAPLLGMSITGFLVLTRKDAAVVAAYSGFWAAIALLIPEWIDVAPLPAAQAAVAATVTVGLVAVFMVGFSVYVARHYQHLAASLGLVVGANHETTIANMVVPAALMGRDGRLLEVNSALCDLLGRRNAQLLGLPLVSLCHPEHAAQLGDVIHRLDDGQVTEAKAVVRLLRADNEELWALLTLALSVAPSQTDERVTVQFVDVTDLKGEIRRLETQLHAQEEFVARVSHELRTPVTAVAGFAELLQDEGSAFSSLDRRQMLETIANEAVDLTNIVEDLLVATRAQVGALTVTTVPVSLRAQLAQTLEAFSQEARSRITVHGSNPASVGDPARVRQILRNLITNALRYGGKNIVVTVGSDQSHSWVTVADDGSGLLPEDRDMVFLPFHRGQGAPYDVQGVGLGLPISRNLARAMNGDLTYERLDGLSVFKLTLPQTPPDSSQSSWQPRKRGR